MGYRFLKSHKNFLMFLTMFILLIIILTISYKRTTFEKFESIDIIYQYGDVNLNNKIKDSNDICIIKKSLTGTIYTDEPSCGFSSNISIVLYTDSKSIVLCPARDNCPKLRINNTNKYIRISDSQRKILNEILKKYGMIFPCV